MEAAVCVCVCVCMCTRSGGQEALFPFPRAAAFGVCCPIPVLEGAVLLEEVMHPR